MIAVWIRGLYERPAEVILTLDAEGVRGDAGDDGGKGPFILISGRRLIVGRSTGGIKVLEP